MKDLLAAAVLLAGSGFVLLAAVGIVRMPDLFTRMQATSKASTLGLLCMALSVGIHFAEAGAAIRAAIIVLVSYLGNPVAAHLIARAAYFVGGQTWEGTVIDELRGRYEAQSHRLRSSDDQQ